MSVANQNCSTCNAAIPDADLESGAAIALLGKRYCTACKGNAVQGVSLDDLMDAPPSAVPGPSDPTRLLNLPDALPKPAAKPAPPKGAAKPAAAKAPAARPAPARPLVTATPPARTPPPRKPTSTARHRPVLRKKSSAGPIIAIAAIAAIAIILTIIVLSVSDGGKPPKPDGQNPPPPVAETPEQKAARAFAKAQSLSRNSDVKYESVLDAIQKARAACANTKYASKLDALKRATLKEKETFEAEKALEGVVEKLRNAVAADKNFRNYGDIMEKFRTARETASKAGAKKLGELQKLQSEYSRKYEDAATPFFKEIHEAARALSREGRYDDALAQINRFPLHLRKSGAWSGLERLKREIEGLKRNSRR